MRNRTRTLTTSLMLLGAMALLLPACASGGGGSAGTADLPRAEPGETFMDEQLKLTKVQGPDNGEMTFTISNVSGAPLEAQGEDLDRLVLPRTDGVASHLELAEHQRAEELRRIEQERHRLAITQTHHGELPVAR